MRKPESCSQSRMRSRTSRGVPEWFGGKELYIGSVVSAIRKVSGSPGIVPGPPEGSRGSTGWGHLSRRAPWAEVGGEPAPSGLVRPPLGPPATRVGNPRGGRTTCLGGHSTPLAAAPLGDSHLQGRRPPGGLYKGGGREGSRTLESWRLPPPATPLPPPAVAWRSPAGVLLHPPPRRRAAGSSSTSPSPLLDQDGGDVTLTVRVLNAEMPSVRR